MTTTSATPLSFQQYHANTFKQYGAALQRGASTLVYHSQHSQLNDSIHFSGQATSANENVARQQESIQTLVQAIKTLVKALPASPEDTSFELLYSGGDSSVGKAIWSINRLGRPSDGTDLKTTFLNQLQGAPVIQEAYFNKQGQLLANLGGNAISNDSPVGLRDRLPQVKAQLEAMQAALSIKASIHKLYEQGIKAQGFNIGSETWEVTRGDHDELTLASGDTTLIVGDDGNVHFYSAPLPQDQDALKTYLQDIQAKLLGCNENVQG